MQYRKMTVLVGTTLEGNKFHQRFINGLKFLFNRIALEFGMDMSSKFGNVLSLVNNKQLNGFKITQWLRFANVHCSLPKHVKTWATMELFSMKLICKSNHSTLQDRS